MRTLIKLLPDHESQKVLKTYAGKQIRKYLLANIERYFGADNTPRVKKAGDLHSTVFYLGDFLFSKNQALSKELSSRLPIILDPSTYKFDFFGDDALVLRYEDERVRNINAILGSAANNLSAKVKNIPQEQESQATTATPTTPAAIKYEFNPHITLARGCTREILENLARFDSVIRFSRFKWVIDQ